MALYCAISNEIPERPCISAISGNVFERRLLEKYIAENGTDPVTGETLSEDQLIDIKVSQPIKPKPPSATSIPAILKMLQDEYDVMMLHSFTMRQQLQTTRQELSHALYQHDAACRVIARLTKEVTAAREALAVLKPQAGVVAATQPLQVQPQRPVAQTGDQPQGMTEEIIQILGDKASHLTAERKKRGKKIPDALTSAETIRKFSQVASHSGLHSASAPGILALDIQQADTSKILTGGVDKNAVVFNKDSEQMVAMLKGHSKKVTHAVYHFTDDVAFTASPDATIRVWSVPNQSCSQIIRCHEKPVTGLSLHATGDYLLSCSEDQHWAFSEIRSGRVISRVSEGEQELRCAQFHPDGLIFGTGTADSMIKIWDLKEASNVATFPGHSGAVCAIAFSENGYYLASAADDAQVKLWDLRKLKNFKTIMLDENYEVNSLCFDQSGTYLGVAGFDVRVYLCKQWNELAILTDHSALATGVRFGANSSFICSSSMDRTLKIYS